MTNNLSRLISVWAFLCLISCTSDVKPKLDIIYKPTYIRLLFDSEQDITSVQLMHENTVVFIKNITYKTSSVRLNVSYKPNTHYEFIVTLKNGKLYRYSAQSPERLSEDVSITVPFGVKSYSLLQDSTIVIPFQAHDRLKIGLHYTTLKDCVQVIFSNKDTLLSKTITPLNSGTFDILTDVSGAYNLRVNNKIYRGNIAFEPPDTLALKKQLKLKGVYLPDEAEYNMSMDNFILQIPDPFSIWLRNILMDTDESYSTEIPFTYLSGTVQSSLNSPSLLLARVSYSDSALYFKTPFTKDKKHFAESVFLAKEAGYSRFRIPVYLNMNEINLIHASATVDLFLYGSNSSLISKKISIYFEYTNYAKYVGFIAIYLFGMYLSISCFLNLKQLLRKIPLNAIVTISIYGSLHFAINYVANFLDLTLLSFLGPFSTFFSSLFREGLYYVILIALLMLFPYKGVVSLKLLISMLLTIVINGSFSVATLYTFGISIFLLEYVAGKMHDLEHGSIWRIALLFALVDAILTYVQLLELQVLYRLFLADWYIWLKVVVVGFLYTCIGVFWGRVFGNYLKQVSTI